MRGQQLFDRVRYTLKKPGSGRVSFAIIQDIVRTDGKRSSRIVDDERVDTLNRLFRDRLKDPTTVEIELRDVIKALYEKDVQRRGRAVYNEENRKILERYWEDRYASRQNVDLKAAWNELNRAIEAAGKHSLTSVKRETLQNEINKKFKGNKQRRTCATLNQILSYCGRDIELTLSKRERRTVRYLSLKEFGQVIKQVKDPNQRLLFSACMGTGGRLGEVFALEEHSVRQGVVFIQTQLDRTEISRETKNRRERHSVVIPSLVEPVEAWAALPDAIKKEIRNDRHAEALTEACQAVFPGNPKKWCNVRDLRHSYAIWLLGQGVSIGLLAQSLGNSEQVCQEYYAGFVLAPENVLAIKAIIGRN